MKKIIFLLLALFLFSTGNVFAQQQVNDYQYQYEKYRQEYKAYELARNEYLKQKTLASQKNAIEKTQAILVQRASVLRIYLMALKYKLSLAEGILSSDRTKLSAQLDIQIQWLQNNADDIQSMSNPTLTDLFEISKRLESRQKSYLNLSYETKARIIIGKAKIVNQKYTSILAEIKPLLLEGGMGFLQNWLNQAQDMSLQASEKIRNAEALISKLQTSDSKQINKAYGEISDYLIEAQRLLQKGAGFQKEIVGQINNN
jgi:hypothetical protein